MIAFVQPFSIHGPGGGARILRSLLSAAPIPHLSVCTEPRYEADPSVSDEIHLPIRPYFGRIEHTRLRRWLGLERVGLWLGECFEDRLARLCETRGVTVIHAIPHGIEFWHAFRVAKRRKIPFILNVHDELDYNLKGHPHLGPALAKLGVVWRESDQNIVISNEMGEEYNRRYGQRPFTVITDGLDTIAPSPRPSIPTRLRVYMMGSVHLSYERNFDALLAALKTLHKNGNYEEVRLAVRPGFPFPIDTRGVDVIEKPWGTQSDVEKDLEEADLLYLPLPFQAAYDSFVRYSLSTKLVTYLGTGIPILYHGPEHSAAGHLLGEYEAAVRVSSLDANVIAESISVDRCPRTRIAENALALARSRFMLADQQQAFWSLVEPSTIDIHSLA
jgi:glycosyltransferase involved in cell wall biosynthesis